MIEVKVAGIRHGRAYIAGDYYKGSFVKRDGVFSSSDITALPTGQKNLPGGFDHCRGDLGLIAGGLAGIVEHDGQPGGGQRGRGFEPGWEFGNRLAGLPPRKERLSKTDHRSLF